MKADTTTLYAQLDKHVNYDLHALIESSGPFEGEEDFYELDEMPEDEVCRIFAFGDIQCVYHTEPKSITVYIYRYIESSVDYNGKKYEGKLALDAQLAGQYSAYVFACEQLYNDLPDDCDDILGGPLAIVPSLESLNVLNHSGSSPESGILSITGLSTNEEFSEEYPCPHDYKDMDVLSIEAYVDNTLLSDYDISN